MSADVTLYQFPFSTFNEKARWALDYKGVPHKRVSCLPGPHAGYITKLSGQPKTPVVTFGDEVVAGSASILAALDDRYPPKPLLPKDESARRDVLAIQERFDEDLGVRTRRAVLSTLMGDPAYMANMFSTGRPWYVRLSYRWLLPMVLDRVRDGNGITGPEAIEDGMNAIRESLDLVYEKSQATGYLVGDGFSAADLTACAHLAPAVNPPDCDMTRPEPMPDTFRQQLDEWAKHPGTDWVRKIYRDHRPPSSAV